MTSVVPEGLPGIGSGLVGLTASYTGQNGPDRVLLPAAVPLGTNGTPAQQAVIRDRRSGREGVRKRERRTLPGVGTYLIDSPRDKAVNLRQQVLTFQERHRGVSRLSDDAWPDIPYRLQHEDQPVTTMSRPQSILKVDMATSPMTPEDLNTGQFSTDSPTPSTSRSVTFLVDPGVRSPRLQQHSKDVKEKIVTKKNSSAKSTSTQSVEKCVATRTERGFRKQSNTRRVRECSKLSLYSVNSDDADKGADPADDGFQTLMSSSRRKSCSMSDLTEAGSSLLRQNRQFGVKTPSRSILNAVNVGPTSLCQQHKSTSLLDLMQSYGGEEDNPVADLSTYHQRQRIAHFAFRRDNNSLRPDGTLCSEEADRQWLDMGSTKLVDHVEYEQFASRRKPSVKKAAKSFTPRSGVDFKLTHPANGKVYPVFSNDGLPIRKFGHTAYRKRPSKAKVNS